MDRINKYMNELMIDNVFSSINQFPSLDTWADCLDSDTD